VGVWWQEVIVNWSLVVETSLVWSGVFVALFGLVLLGGVLVAPDAMVQDYPPAIRERYGPKSPRGERVGKVMAAPARRHRRLQPAASSRCGTGWAAASASGRASCSAPLSAALHVFDLLVVDWLLFCTIRPRLLVLPGTEGMPDAGTGCFIKVLFPAGAVAAAHGAGVRLSGRPGHGAVVLT
jgi:hypothetical protein